MDPVDETDVHVDSTIVTDELNIKEYDSDFSTDTDNQPDSCVTARKRKPSPDPTTGTHKRSKRYEELHDQLCNLEIDLLRMFIEKERVKAEYKRSLLELKLRRLKMKTCSKRT